MKYIQHSQVFIGELFQLFRKLFQPVFGKLFEPVFGKLFEPLFGKLFELFGKLFQSIQTVVFFGELSNPAFKFQYVGPA